MVENGWTCKQRADSKQDHQQGRLQIKHNTGIAESGWVRIGNKGAG